MTNTTFISGLCQSRKTQKTLDVIAHICTENGLHEHGNAKTLLLYVTQAGSTINAFQVIQRMRCHSILGRVFSHIIRSYGTRDIKSSPERHIAVVDFFHKKNVDSMLRIASSFTWHNIICIIDEADQGGPKGLRGRLNIVQCLDDIQASASARHLHTIFVTATVPNLCRLLKSVPEDSYKNNGLVYRLLGFGDNGEPVKHLFVSPQASYVSMEWFYQTKNMRIIPSVKNEEEDTQTKRTALKDSAVEVLQNLPQASRQLVLLSFSNSKETQASVAAQLVTDGAFDIALCLNSDNLRNYIVVFASDSGNGVMKPANWAIPNDSVMRAANRGRLAKYITDSGVAVETGIESAHDISLSQLLFSSLLTHDDFAASLAQTATAYRAQLIALRNFIIERRPRHFPSRPNARIAIIGGNMLSRGITIQDPQIGFTCTAFVFMDIGGSSSDAGASHTQKAGRALGNMKDFFEGGKSGRVPPIMAISSNLFVSALSNERLTYQKGKANDGAVIDVKNYITMTEYKSMVKHVRNETKNM